MNKIVGVLFVAYVTVASVVLSGCSATANMGEHAQVSGSPDALRAMFDGLNGMAKTAKESPDAENQYFVARDKYESNVTVRGAQKGFFQKLFGQEQEAVK